MSMAQQPAGGQSCESGAAASDMLTDLRFYGLYYQAENVRWSFNDINWDKIEKNKVSPELLKHVRHVVDVEFNTFPGAMNFFREFSDDVDFTQWVTVWL